MDKNILSSQESNDLLSKLVLERIPVHALLTSPTGSQISFSGFVDGRSSTQLVISAERPPSFKTGFIIVPLSRVLEVSYCDEREAPKEVRETLVPELGNTVLLLRFPESKEFLFLTFTL
jgi:hypothetical protein